MIRPLAPLALAVFAVAFATAPVAQDQYDQALVGALLDRPGVVPETPVRYAEVRLAHPSGNSVLARHALYTRVGDGDARLGRERLGLTHLLGGPRVGELRIGETVVVPASSADFDLGALAFAPYPQMWPGAARTAKVVVVDKTTQTWAAYDSGHLARWGPASTGAAATPTPAGRFTMNWREMERESTEAPPGETWLMRYVMNIDAARGIHLHQYDAVLTGPPQGHGCVRMVEADARWLWAWSEPERRVGRRTVPGTLVVVQGTEPPGAPVRFTDGPAGPERVEVRLPADPLAVPRGDR